MKRSILIAAMTLMSFSAPSFADDYFQEWCDAYTAQELISLAANRIYGNTSGLSDADYKKRSDWVNDGYARAAESFKKKTGHNLMGYAFQQGGNWMNRCQTVDQIK